MVVQPDTIPQATTWPALCVHRILILALMQEQIVRQRPSGPHRIKHRGLRLDLFQKLSWRCLALNREMALKNQNYRALVLVGARGGKLVCRLQGLLHRTRVESRPRTRPRVF